MNNEPLEPVRGSWDVEIKKFDQYPVTAEEQARIDQFATEASEAINESWDEVPASIESITFRKIL